MFEVYSHRKIKELGKFDDDVCSFEIDREGTDVKASLIASLQSGFQLYLSNARRA